MAANHRWDYLPPQHKNPLKAIRAMCISCMGGGNPHELIANCHSSDCALYAFRFGRNPHRKPSTAKQQEARRKNLKKIVSDAQKGRALGGQN